SRRHASTGRRHTVRTPPNAQRAWRAVRDTATTPARAAVRARSDGSRGGRGGRGGRAASVFVALRRLPWGERRSRSGGGAWRPVCSTLPRPWLARPVNTDCTTVAAPRTRVRFGAPIAPDCTRVSRVRRRLFVWVSV